MRATRVSLNLGSTGYAPTILHDTWQTPNNITLALSGANGSGAVSGTCTVLYTVDDLSDAAARFVASITQSTNTITVTGDNGWPGPGGFTGTGNISQAGNGDAGAHNLVVGDMVILEATGAKMDGIYTVTTVVSATSYTLTSMLSQTATASQSARVTSARMYTHSVLAAINLATNPKSTSNYTFPVTSSTLQCTIAGAGIATLAVLQGGMSS